MNPPYVPSTLHAPLTAAQRQEIIAWIMVTFPLFIGGSVQDPHKLNDAALIKQYTGLWGVWGFKRTPSGPGAYPGINSTLDFLKKLGEWLLDPVRMGEAIVGVLLVAVGVNAILKNPAGKVKTQATRAAAFIPK